MKTPPLLHKIKSRSAQIGVIGLGYVGLPLAVAFAEAGFQVTGIDTDPKKVKAIQAGKNYIDDISNTSLEKFSKSGRLHATCNYAVIEKLDAISICVPTPLRKTRNPNISHILHATAELKKHRRSNQLIVLESTTYPGSTEELLLPKLSSEKFQVGRDFFLAFSPERIDPGNALYNIKNTPKIIGGITAQCSQLATLLYQQISTTVITVSSAKCAEMVKLLENTFRAVNIGLVNEIALICDKLKIDTWEVIRAAATKPFGFMPFYPGPGLGGHCIPVDPEYLSWKLRRLNYTTRFIDLASKVNREMPSFVVRKIQHSLQKKSLRGAKILLLGVAYKKNAADTRESPAYDVAKLLWEAGAKLIYSDPHVAKWKTDWANYRSQKLSPSLLKKQDGVVILTDHDDFNYKQIIQHAALIVDTRNATDTLSQQKIIKL